ncbi:TetR/AcrR family transcriptional regulator [Nocardia sp. MW-W600-9]
MSTDRRAQLVTGAIDLIATSGIRALTHRALDTRLGLPLGSTSYYFRTRHALIEAVADGITARSRADFAAARREPAGDPAHDIAAWVDHLLAHRRNELIARHALLIEVLSDPDLHERLAGSLFSLDGATELCTALGAAEPRESAGDLLAVLEGLVFDRLAGVRAGVPAGTPDSVAQLARPLRCFLGADQNQETGQPNSE